MPINLISFIEILFYRKYLLFYDLKTFNYVFLIDLAAKIVKE